MSDGFMGFWSDIDADYRRRYREWHNCEHIPERVGIPGFIEGRRYRALADGPAFFMCYVTAGPEVLSSPSYLAALNRPTPWTQEALTHFRNPERSLYRRLGGFGTISPHAPYIALLRFNHERPTRDLLAILQDQAAAQPAGRGRISLYDMETDASQIMTAERKIYAAGPGERRYLAAAEHHVRDEAEAAAARIAHALGPGTTDLNSAVYWLEIRIRSEDVPGATTPH